MTYGKLLGFLIEECNNTECEHCVLEETCKEYLIKCEKEI